MPFRGILPCLANAHNMFCSRSQGCNVRCASSHIVVSIYRVTQMQGVGRADVLLYFKCPTTKQMRCPVNAYHVFNTLSDIIIRYQTSPFSPAAKIRLQVGNRFNILSTLTLPRSQPSHTGPSGIFFPLPHPWFVHNTAAKKRARFSCNVF